LMKKVLSFSQRMSWNVQIVVAMQPGWYASDSHCDNLLSARHIRATVVFRHFRCCL
jgi:hypothetical protein